jgi:phosphatidylglycerol:prolipoprotein diacylglycerol transferase
MGLWAAMQEAKRTGQDPELYVDYLLWMAIPAIAGARLYYVIFSWDYYKQDLTRIFKIREGGLAIFGGIIVGVLVMLIFSRAKKQSFWKMIDTISMSILIGQIMGRWGNFFNREAFGGYTDNFFAMQLPVSAVRQNEITQEMWDNVVVQNGIRFIQVHPTFLYEGMWNCLVLLLLFLMRNRTRFEGELFLLYLAGYGTGRFFIEMLRTDQLLIPGTGIPVSMVVSASAVIISLILIAVLGRTEPAGNTRAD